MHPRATQYLIDFLDIIQHKMLAIEKEHRSKAAELVSEFNRLDDKCKADPAYCTTSVLGALKPVSSISVPSQPVSVVIRHPSMEFQELMSRAPHASPARPAFHSNGSHLRR